LLNDAGVQVNQLSKPKHKILGNNFDLRQHVDERRVSFNLSTRIISRFLIHLDGIFRTVETGLEKQFPKNLQKIIENVWQIRIGMLLKVFR